MKEMPGSGTSRSLILLCITALFTLCSVAIYIYSRPVKMVNQDKINDRTKRTNDPWNRHAVDSAVSLLQTGDLVVRNGIDMTSDLLRQLNQTDKTYSHCGLVVIENGQPYVYHSIGGEDNPDAQLRRDPAAFFFSPYNNFRIGIARYNTSEQVKQRMIDIVRTYFRQKVRFDMDFDLKTDDRLYCAEFVYKTMNKATADSLYIVPTKMFGHTFVSVDNLYLNPHTTMIWQVRYK